MEPRYYGVGDKRAMKIGKIHIKRSYILLGSIFFVVIFFACSPLMTKHCINGHDVDYHLLRIESLKEGILAGKPFLKVNMLFLGGAGYASSLFYPDLLLYFPGVLRALGVSINQSYHLFVALCIILCYASTYICTKMVTKKRFSSMIGAIIMTLSQYHIDDIYTRSAVGEFTAFIFLPFLLYGIYDLLYEELSKPGIMAMGFAGVLLSHTNTFIMCILLYGFIVLFHYKIFYNNKKLFLKLLLTGLITLALTCFYWLPVLEQLKDSTFGLSNSWVSVKDTMREISSIFENQMPGMGIAIFLLCIPRLFTIKTKKNKKLLVYGDILLFSGIAFSLGATVLFPWERLERFVNFIQFPWRFYLLASACLSMGIAILYEIYFQNRKSREAALIAVLGIMIFSSVTNIQRTEEGYYSYSDDYYSYKPFTASVIGGEWLPEQVDSLEKVLEYSDKIVGDSGEEISFYRKKNEIHVSCKNMESSYMDVPFIYYKGYRAVSYDNEGEKIEDLKVSGEGRHGFCRVYFTGKEEGKVVIAYKGTWAQKISYFISAGAMGAVFMLSRKRRIF